MAIIIDIYQYPSNEGFILPDIKVGNQLSLQFEKDINRLQRHYIRKVDLSFKCINIILMLNMNLTSANLINYRLHKEVVNLLTSISNCEVEYELRFIIPYIMTDGLNDLYVSQTLNSKKYSYISKRNERNIFIDNNDLSCQ